MTTKKCGKCGLHLDLGDFGKDRSTATGLASACKPCVKTRARDTYARNRESRIARVNEYTARNGDAKRAYHRQYQHARSRSDPSFRIGNLLRRRLHESIVRDDGNCRYADLIGIGNALVRLWIEFQWEPGMSWDNHGEWHIDHVLPIARFDLVDPAHRAVCFAWTNLSPLWKPDNIRKSSSILPWQFFNVVVSATRFIRLHGLSAREYQRVRESVLWLGETTRGMVTSSWMKAALPEPPEIGNPQCRP